MRVALALALTLGAGADAWAHRRDLQAARSPFRSSPS
jgi:hypothetical protein